MTQGKLRMSLIIPGQTKQTYSFSVFKYESNLSNYLSVHNTCGAKRSYL